MLPACFVVVPAVWLMHGTCTVTNKLEAFLFKLAALECLLHMMLCIQE